MGGFVPILHIFVYIYMYMCVCVCVCVCMYMYVCIYIYIYICICIYIYIYVTCLCPASCLCLLYSISQDEVNINEQTIEVFTKRPSPDGQTDCSSCSSSSSFCSSSSSYLSYSSCSYPSFCSPPPHAPPLPPATPRLYVIFCPTGVTADWASHRRTLFLFMISFPLFLLDQSEHLWVNLNVTILKILVVLWINVANFNRKSWQTLLQWLFIESRGQTHVDWWLIQRTDIS